MATKKQMMRREMQEILEREDCEELSPNSQSVHSGAPSLGSNHAATASSYAGSAVSSFSLFFLTFFPGSVLRVQSAKGFELNKNGRTVTRFKFTNAHVCLYK